MLFVLLAKIFMFILNDICFTLLSILVLKTCCSNNTSNWHLPLLSPPFSLKCIAVVRRSFFLVSTVIERIKRDKQLLMFNWSDSRQGENALNTKLLQFLSFIKLCDSKSSVVRIKPFHSLTPMSDQRFAPALALVWLEWKCTCVGKMSIECYSNNI